MLRFLGVDPKIAMGVVLGLLFAVAVFFFARWYMQRGEITLYLFVVVLNGQGHRKQAPSTDSSAIMGLTSLIDNSNRTCVMQQPHKGLINQNDVVIDVDSDARKVPSEEEDYDIDVDADVEKAPSEDEEESECSRSQRSLSRSFSFHVST